MRSGVGMTGPPARLWNEAVPGGQEHELGGRPGARRPKPRSRCPTRFCQGAGHGAVRSWGPEPPE